MKYKITMSDEVTDTELCTTLEANDCFEAIDKVVAGLKHPNETRLIEAVPVSLPETRGATL